MPEVVHADVFFFISSVATVLVISAALVASYYIIKILRDISVVTAKIRKASKGVEEDFEAFRGEIRNEGVKMRAIVDLGLGFLLSRMQKKAAPRKTKPSVEPVQEEQQEGEGIQ